MPFSLPEPFALFLMRQRGQGKARIGETDALVLVAQDLIGSFHQSAFMTSDRLTMRFVDPVLEDQLVDVGHAGQWSDQSTASTWTLVAQAI